MNSCPVIQFAIFIGKHLCWIYRLTSLYIYIYIFIYIYIQSTYLYICIIFVFFIYCNIVATHTNTGHTGFTFT